MQHYIDPNGVLIPEETRSDKMLRKCLWFDGQITPVLVVMTQEGRFEAAGSVSAERVQTARELRWPTILVEDDFLPEEAE